VSDPVSESTQKVPYAILYVAAKLHYWLLAPDEPIDPHASHQRKDRRWPSTRLISLGVLCALEALTKAGQAPSRVPNSPAKRESIGSQSRFC
jgi:hypothetical protein